MVVVVQVQVVDVDALGTFGLGIWSRWCGVAVAGKGLLWLCCCVVVVCEIMRVDNFLENNEVVRTRTY